MTDHEHPGAPVEAAHERIGSWLARLAEPTPAPGGGAAAALTLATAAAVAQMTAGYAPVGAEREAVCASAALVREAALRALDADARASAGLVAAYRALATGGDARRQQVLRVAIVQAASAAAAIGAAGAPLIGVLEWVDAHGAPRLRADLAVAARLLTAAALAASATLATNLTAGVDAALDPTDLARVRRDLADADALASDASRIAAAAASAL